MGGKDRSRARLMKPVQAFQILLMGQMRNSAAMADAIRQMGFDASALAVAKRIVGRDHALIPGPLRPDGFQPFLGTPLRVEPALGPDDAHRAKAFYKLPLWPEFEFELTMAPVHDRESFTAKEADIDFRDYVVVGLRFVRPAASKACELGLEQIVPWHVVEDDLALSCEKVVLLESWFPMHEVYCMLRNPPGAEYFLVFDFGLLQHARPWKDLHVNLDDIAATRTLV